MSLKFKFVVAKHEPEYSYFCPKVKVCTDQVEPKLINNADAIHQKTTFEEHARQKEKGYQCDSINNHSPFEGFNETIFEVWENVFANLKLIQPKNTLELHKIHEQLLFHSSD